MLTRLRQEEDGFTLIESVMALGVVFAALLALVYTATLGLTDVAFSRQRQQATAVANRLIEEVRGLPYESVTEGLSDSDLSGDPNIVACSDGEHYFKVCPSQDPNAERIAHTPNLPPTAPLVPHTGAVGPPEYTTTYSWSVYVSEVDDPAADGILRVTAIVSWSNPQRRGVASSVEVQTLVYGPEGCVDSSTHPFTGPCRPFFYGTGAIEPGTITITGMVDGLQFDSMVVEISRLEAAAQVEQTASVQGALTLPAIRQVVAGVTTVGGGGGAVSGADNDPTTATEEYSREGAGPSPSKNLLLSGDGNALSLSTAGAHQGETISTTSAGGANACNGQADGLSCGYGTAQARETVQGALTIGGLDTATLIQIARQDTADSAYVRRVASSGDGTIRETMTRTVPEIRVGGLFEGMRGPNRWPGYWVALRDYAVTADAEAGVGAGSPWVDITGGSIVAWRAPGPEETPVTVEGGEVVINELHYTERGARGAKVSVDISGSVRVAGSTTKETRDPANSAAIAEAQAVAGAPLVADIRYQVTVNGDVRADLRIVVALGSATAQTSYQLGTAE